MFSETLMETIIYLGILMLQGVQGKLLTPSLSCIKYKSVLIHKC